MAKGRRAAQGCSGTAGAEGTSWDTSIQPEGPPDLKSSWSKDNTLHRSIPSPWLQTTFTLKKGQGKDAKQMANAGLAGQSLPNRAVCLSSDTVLPRAQPPTQQKGPTTLPRVETPTQQQRHLTILSLHKSCTVQLYHEDLTPTKAKGSSRYPLAPDPPCRMARTSSEGGFRPGSGR